MSTSTNKDIGRRVAAYRRLAKLTASELAERVPGLTANGVAKIEGGHRAVLPIELVLEIAFALRVPPAALIFPLGSPNATVNLGGEDWEAWRLYPWIVGPQSHDEGEWETSPGAHGSLLVELARSTVELSKEIDERWGEDGEHATTPEDQRKYLNTRSQLWNTAKALRWINRQLPQPSRDSDGDD